MNDDRHNYTKVDKKKTRINVKSMSQNLKYLSLYRHYRHFTNGMYNNVSILEYLNS